MKLSKIKINPKKIMWKNRSDEDYEGYNADLYFCGLSSLDIARGGSKESWSIIVDTYNDQIQDWYRGTADGAKKRAIKVFEKHFNKMIEDINKYL